MHYRNGRAANNGDKVVQLGTSDAKINTVGTLIDAVPGNDFCNGKIVTTNNVAAMTTTACLCDCLHVDDVEALLAEKGLDKRPEGK